MSRSRLHRVEGPYVSRTLEHWTPQDGPLREWLSEMADEGWVCEYPWPPQPVVVNGRWVWPYAMVDVGSFARGLATRQPGQPASLEVVEPPA